jgi:hypothetical protein
MGSSACASDPAELKSGARVRKGLRAGPSEAARFRRRRAPSSHSLRRGRGGCEEKAGRSSVLHSRRCDLTKSARPCGANRTSPIHCAQYSSGRAA